MNKESEEFEDFRAYRSTLFTLPMQNEGLAYDKGVSAFKGVFFPLAGNVLVGRVGVTRGGGGLVMT